MRTRIFLITGIVIDFSDTLLSEKEIKRIKNSIPEKMLFEVEMDGFETDSIEDILFEKLEKRFDMPVLDFKWSLFNERYV